MPNKNVPQTIHDDALGSISLRTCGSQFAAYDATIDIEGKSVELDLYSDAHLDIKPTIRRAKDLIDDFTRIVGRARKFFYDEFVPHYDRVWRREGDPEPDASLFDEMELFVITVTADGAMLTFDAGELLGEHLLQLHLNKELQFVEWDTPG